MAATLTSRWPAMPLLVMALLSVACGTGGDDDNTGQPAQSVYASMAEALCAAADAGGRADRAASRRAFFDGAHQPLHELAAEVADHDRAAAGRLLEGKEAVESAFDDEGARVPFERLLPAVDAALDVVDVPALPCSIDEENAP